ncbi:MAG: carboxylesterase family protein [Enhygromyxa sp.]
MLDVPFPSRFALTLSIALTCAACKDDPGPQPRRADQADLDALVVATDQGRVRGAVDHGTHVFRGLPYAAAPIGELRFRAPLEPAAWEGIRDASKFGSRCPQLGAFNAAIGDEDCLNLNLWRPATPASEPRPVLVFIHGGANVLGSGSDTHVDGRRLAQSRDLIVVTFNYRLGLLGFLALPELTAESGTSGNWAHLDQIAALKWVARNIAAFGGDPNRVTIVGESAGALGVCVLLASPLAAGLFHGAVMQSGGCDVAPLEQRERSGARLAEISGCGPANDILECLRGLPISNLLALSTPPTEISNWLLPTAGAVDGVVLPSSPWASFAAGTHNVVPTLVGSNADETALFIAESYRDCAAYEGALTKAFGDRADEVLGEYPCSNYPDGQQAYVAATTDAIFSCQARRILRSLAPAAAASSTPLFRYWYAHARADPAIRDLGAFHGSEVQVLFGNLSRIGFKPPARERELSEAMQLSWAALAAAGSPVHAGTPGWEPYEVARDNAVIFASPITAAEGVGTSHCEFWDAL